MGREEDLWNVVDVGNNTQSDKERIRIKHKTNKNRKLGGTKLLSLDNICSHTLVAKGLSQTCLQDTTKFLDSTDNNSKE